MSAQGHPAASKTVKLALKGANAEKDGPFLRIQVPEEIGSQTMKTLHSRSLDLWRMHNGTEVKDLKNAKVVLTYLDVENEVCYIISEEDLLGAMSSSPQSLRVFARVEFPKPSSPMPELNAPSSQLKDSFSEDAAGNGAALGETMDSVVSSINDFSAVLLSNSLDDAGEKSGLITRNSGEKEVVTTTESSFIILDGDDNQEGNESQNSGDVVNKESDKQGETTDEVLARAAQVIGSALFESDITRSNTVNSNGEATNSTVSMLGSNHPISTSLPSVSSLNALLLSRWALQLKQLHELGFYDDGLNVEIMERMNAANIGSDLMEEVSVESVVNELLHYWYMDS